MRFKHRDPDVTTSCQEVKAVSFLCTLIKHKKHICISVILGMMFGAAVFVFRPRLCYATTTIVSPNAILGSSRGQIQGLPGSGMMARLFGQVRLVDIYGRVLRSREVLDEIIQRFDLQNISSQVIEIKNARFRLIRATVIRGTNEEMLSITVRDTSGERAAAIANTYVLLLRQKLEEIVVGRAANRRASLEKRLQAVETKLSGVDRLLYSDTANTELIYETLACELEFARIAEAEAVPNIHVLDSAIADSPVEAASLCQYCFGAGIAFALAGILVVFLVEADGGVQTRASKG